MSEPRIEFSPYIGKLMLAYFLKTITPQEQDQLDTWVEASFNNQKIFEEFVEIAFRELPGKGNNNKHSKQS